VQPAQPTSQSCQKMNFKQTYSSAFYAFVVAIGLAELYSLFGEW